MHSQRKTKSKSSRRWLQEHFSDVYVKKAQHEQYRSRAVYKLIEIHEKDKLFKPGMTVIDLGAAPGGWSQWIVNQVKPNGRVIAVDRLPIQPIAGVECIQGDFTDPLLIQSLLNRLSNTPVDWVISDMAPNLSGIHSVDQAQSLALAEEALHFSLQVLSNQQGGFLVKIFQSDLLNAFIDTLKLHFKSVVLRKPKASRNRSSEIYLLAKNR